MGPRPQEHRQQGRGPSEFGGQEVASCVLLGESRPAQRGLLDGRHGPRRAQAAEDGQSRMGAGENLSVGRKEIAPPVGQTRI